jgi:hypothetical protein
MATPREQLEAMRCLGENWDSYGAAAPQTSLIDLAQEFTGLIEAMLKKFVAEPTVVHVSPTRVGGILIDWEDRWMQHEVELNPDRCIEFLQLNKSTDYIQTRRLLS